MNKSSIPQVCSLIPLQSGGKRSSLTGSDVRRVIAVLECSVQSDIGIQRIAVPVPYMRRGRPHAFVKDSGKIVDAGETAALSDLRKLLIGAADQLVGFANLEKVDIFADGEAGGTFENLAEIIFGVAEMVCQLVQRNVLTVVLREIIGDLPLQTGQLCDPLLQRVIEGDVCGHGRAVTKVKIQGLLKEKGGHRLGIRSAGGPFPPHVLLQLPKGAVREGISRID